LGFKFTLRAERLHRKAQAATYNLKPITYNLKLKTYNLDLCS